MTKDLRGFLVEYERANPKEVCRIEKEVDPKYEVAAILTRLEQMRKLPIIHYENVKGSSFPVVTNVYSTKKKIAASLGVDPKKFRETYLAAVENTLSPKTVSDGPVMEETIGERDFDFNDFPLMTYHEGDAAPYLTAGMVLAEDPETGQVNASFNRLMYQSRNRAGIFMTVGKHLHEMYSKMEDQNKPLPITISIGNHPAWALGALYIGPYGDDELGIIGGLLKRPVEVMRGELSGTVFPADAEIVLEAVIEPHIREEEGPFCEFSGYATGKGLRPVVTIKSAHMRKDAIYQDICGGQHREHLVMATIPMEANFYRTIMGAVPTLVDVHVPAPFSLIVSINKRFAGQAQSAMIAAFSSDLYLKHVIVVDQDINIVNLQEVIWAIATRVQADTDILIIPGVRGSSLDPSCGEEGVVTKMGIDATAKPSLSSFAKRNKVPKEVMDRLRLESYLNLEDL
ncbi:UbiD family decarboxylase [Acidobacteria bacterium AH-259-D05]|nr:UbiD family decarboxylase [Acidobacteria bacterium AH-259-D05]